VRQECGARHPIPIINTGQSTEKLTDDSTAPAAAVTGPVTQTDSPRPLQQPSHWSDRSRNQQLGHRCCPGVFSEIQQQQEWLIWQCRV